MAITTETRRQLLHQPSDATLVHDVDMDWRLLQESDTASLEPMVEPIDLRGLDIDSRVREGALACLRPAHEGMDPRAHDESLPLAGRCVSGMLA